MEAPKPLDAGTGVAEGRYSQLESFREPFLRRARQCSELTIPRLIPPDGFMPTSDLYTPFQSIGSRGALNLAAKLLMTLFPPNTPFHRMMVELFAAKKMAQNEQFKTEIESALQEVEQATKNEIETLALRPPAHEALLHLIVGGNVLFFKNPKGGVRVFPLARFVVKRDPSDKLLEILIKEDVSPIVLPTILGAEKFAEYQAQEKPLGDDRTCHLYTHVKLVGDKYEVYQEVKAMRVPGSEGSYPVEFNPYLALRFNRIDGEDYGRGYVEDLLGDLRSLESLSQSVVEGSAAASKMLILVDPNGTTDKDTISKSPNGAVAAGKADDVSVLQMEKYADFKIAAETAAEIKQRLELAFLLHTAIQRKGERVTAEEIRYMAGELEVAIGGIYSLLSQDWQLPLVKLIMRDMERAGKLPKLPKDIVKPVIVTGLEALGRGHDLRKLDEFVGGSLQVLGPELVGAYMNVGDYLTRRATAIGLESPKSLVRTEDEVAQMRQQQQQQAMVEKLGPNAINKLGDAVNQRMAQGGQQPQAEEAS